MTLCWADGVRVDQPSVLKLDDGYAIYKPDGSICLQVSNDGPTSNFIDGQGNLIAQIESLDTSRTGMAVVCGPTKYEYPVNPPSQDCQARVSALNPLNQAASCQKDGGTADRMPSSCAPPTADAP